jgi:predicted DNA-binding transcriptional regulator AlpA
MSARTFEADAIDILLAARRPAPCSDKSQRPQAPGTAIPFDHILSPRQASQFTGLSVATLQRQRSSGGGIPFIKLGSRRVAYRHSDVMRWLESRLVCSTTDARQRGLSA